MKHRLAIFTVGAALVIGAARVPADTAVATLATWAVNFHLPGTAAYLNSMFTGTIAGSNLASWAFLFRMPGLAKHLPGTVDTAVTWVAVLTVFLPLAISIAGKLIFARISWGS
jgi:hypothetical protein